MSTAVSKEKLRPIIYVRGFAGTENEIEDTVADPYMGFNLGATKFKQAWTGTVRRHYFESPLIRLLKDFDYRDVYTDGTYMPSGQPFTEQSIVIYRYYDEQFYDELDDEGDGQLPAIRPKVKASETEVRGKRREIEDFAAGLGKLILRVRNRICDGDKAKEKDFKVYLVGHSMGGLIIRSFLQHVGHGGPRVKTRYGAAWEKRFQEAKGLVDKVVTFATPHNGIESGVLGSVPSFFTMNDVDNFNRKRMREYLDLPAWTGDRADNLLGRFDPRRFLCLVGTNHHDYAVLYGWSRRLVGPMSDGLVKIANAAVHSQAAKTAKVAHAPRAFVHRSHSGHFGIVNSEESYQNLTRFLFGDVRADGELEVDEVTLPKEIQEKKDNGKTIRASYHVECVVVIRGIECELHRRTRDEGSAVFRTFDELVGNNGVKRRNPYLFSLFLRSDARVDQSDPSLGFAVYLRVAEPEYEVDRLLFDKRYVGKDILNETIEILATPPDKQAGRSEWSVKYGTRSSGGLPETEATLRTLKDGRRVFEIPVEQKGQPGLKGKLRIYAGSHS